MRPLLGEIDVSPAYYGDWAFLRKENGVVVIQLRRYGETHGDFEVLGELTLSPEEWVRTVCAVGRERSLMDELQSKALIWRVHMGRTAKMPEGDE